jgi:hypothetical protein
MSDIARGSEGGPGFCNFLFQRVGAYPYLWNSSLKEYSKRETTDWARRAIFGEINGHSSYKFIICSPHEKLKTQL